MFKIKKVQNTFLAVLSLFISFLLIETGVRIFYKFKSQYIPHPYGLNIPDAKRSYKLAPNFRGFFLDQENHLISKAKTNSIGLRDYEYGEKKDNVYRILVLGDSFTFGSGVEMEDTFPKQLEILLNEGDKKRKYEVLNAGVQGYGTDQEFYFLEEWIDKLKPDLVIVGFYVENDITDVMIGALNHYIVKDGYLFDNHKHNAIEKEKNFMERHSQAYEFLEERTRKLMYKTGLARHVMRSHYSKPPLDMMLYLKEPPPEIKDAYDKTEGYLKKISDLSMQKGAETLIMIIPHNMQVIDKIWYDWLKSYRQNPQDYSITKINDEIKDFAKGNNIVFFDLLDKQRMEEQKTHLFLPSDMHWNNEGHKLVAQDLYSFLSEKGLLK